MKKRKLGLFPKVLIAITIGSLLGLIAPDIMIRILKTFNVFFAQILKFIVPLLVLGLVTPSVANLGRGAGKMLLSVIVISYLSTIGAGFFAYGCASNLLPHYLSIGEISTSALEGKVFEPYFNIKFPPICDILTALLLSFMLGVGIIFTKAPGLKKAFDEFGEIVKLTIERAIIPLLPFYIFTMICEMSAAGHLSTVMGTGIKVIATGVILSICYLIIQYIIAGLIAKKNPFKCIWKHYSGISDRLFNLLQFGCYSCHSRMKNGATKEIANFTVPLCSTVHMCGSTIKLITTSVAVMYLSGMNISFALFVNFILLQGISAVAAPGVMGGVLMASIGLLESVLGFSPEQSALMMTIYLALDGYGPACNVSGDGAITLIIDRFFAKKYASAQQ